MMIKVVQHMLLLGGLFQKSNYKYTEINIDSLLREYIKFIRPKWMSATIQSTLSTISEIPNYAKILKNSKPLIDSINLINKDIYEANNKFDYELFQYFLNQELLANFSFCSNLENYNTIKNCDFLTLTTSNNNIVRLKRDKSNTHINSNSNSNILSDKSVTDDKQKKKECENTNSSNHINNIDSNYFKGYIFLIKDTSNNVLGKVTIESFEPIDIGLKKLKKNDIYSSKFILELDKSTER